MGKTPPFSHPNTFISIFFAFQIFEYLTFSIKKMFNSFIEYQRQGSNWTVDKVVDLTMHMARYRPLKGSSYIPLGKTPPFSHPIAFISIFLLFKYLNI
jgi:hypothetical protein